MKSPKPSPYAITTGIQVETPYLFEPSPLCGLPLELLDHIAGYIVDDNTCVDATNLSSTTGSASRRSLYNLALASPHLRASAQRQLFKAIVLGANDEASSFHHYASCYCLVRTLLDRPNLATKVRTLSLKIDPHLEKARALAEWRRDNKPEQYLDGISVYSRPHEWDTILDKCEDVIRASHLPAPQKTKWHYDLYRHLMAPLGGIILSLSTNLEDLLLDAPRDNRPERGIEPLASLFGGFVNEDKKRRASPKSYEYKLRISGKPSLKGLQYIPGLSQLQSLRIITNLHISLRGLKHLPDIKKLYLAVQDCHHLAPRFTQRRYGEFQNIESLRIMNVDNTTCKWLEPVFSSQRNEFPRLKKMEVVLEPSMPWVRQRLIDLVLDMAEDSGVDVVII